MKNLKSLTCMLLVSMTLFGCIGTDIVEEIIVEEQLTITSRILTLAIGDSFQFEADFFDELGERTNGTTTWSSSDDQIISITADGLATALASGEVTITVASGSTSDSISLSTGPMTTFRALERTGSFMGLRNYTVNGDFTLSENGDNLELTFSSNFQSSNGPGLFVYLSNNSTRVTGGIELGQLSANSGTQTYIISRQNAELDTYNHVIIYCKPFGVAFGTGEFDN
ncbi:DM13 domain-containing protein [Roseivirga misakiensis]|nr:DM13 domain-containing protein [Roseivirga misakiensis]